MGHTGFSLIFPDADKTQGFLWRILTCILLFVGFFGCFWNVFGLSGTGVSLPLLLLCGCIYCVISCGLQGRIRFLYIAAALAPVMLVILASNLIVEGSNVALNQALLTSESYLGSILPRYAVNENINQPLCAFLFLLLPAAGLGTLCGKAVSVGRGWKASQYILVVLLWVVAFAFLAPLPTIFVAMVLLAMVVPHIMWRGKIKDNGRAYPWLFGIVAVLVLVASLSGIVGGSDSDDAQGTRLDAARYVHALRHENCGHALPEGDFANLPNISVPSAESFFSASSETDAWYLRGFVGEVYLGNGWMELSPARRAEYATLFSWLHDRGFYAQNQYAMLSRALGIDDMNADISIYSADVCTAYLYSPYEVADSDADERGIGDKNLPASGLRGETDYIVSVSAGSVLNYEQLYSGLSTAYQNGAPEADEYLTSENAYREFVYANYLEIPHDDRETIISFLAGQELPEGQIGFADAKLIVDAYLNTLGYREKPWTGSSDGDFLSSFLEDEEAGASYHFATAATLIFRYLGVPARYVEGYRLDNTEVQAARNDGAIALSADNAWVWVEIYRDGIGFVPFTLSPTNVPDTIQQNQFYDDSETQNVNPNAPEFNPLELFRPPAGLIVIPILIIAFMLVRRGIKRHRARKFLSVADNAEAVNRMTVYLLYALSYLGITYRNGSLAILYAEIENKFGECAGKEYAKVLSIQQAALFSGEAIAVDERKLVSVFLAATIAQIRKQAKPLERLRLWWIVCLT